MKHKKVVKAWYEVSFSASHRTLGDKLNEFLADASELSNCKDEANELWEENTTVLRDYEGDFEGYLIYHNDVTSELIKFICVKLEIQYEDVKDLNFKLVS